MDDVVDALVDAICSNDTTLDDAAGREAVCDALSEVLDLDPDIDAFAMPPEYIREVWLRTVSYHVFQDIMLDLGAGLQNRANGNHVLLNDRKVAIRDFIRETYRQRLDAMQTQGRVLNRDTADRFARELTAEVLRVFEEWL